MKKLIYLIILSLGIISCKPSEEKEIDNSSFIGKWNWTNTDGGINDNIHKTPNTTGKVVSLILSENNTYSIIENGNEISNGTYEVIMKKSIYSGEMEPFITYSNQYNNQNVVISGIIKVLDYNKLSIADNNVDGLESKYVRSN